MASRKGIEDKECDVKGCKETAQRSVSTKKIAKAGLSIAEGSRGKVHICKEHYRELKRLTKEDRKLERLGWPSSSSPER